MNIWEVFHCPAFPNQENNKECTARPAIVFENLQDDVEVFPVTKQIQNQAKYKKTIFVSKDSFEGREMGLTFDSIIILDRKSQLKKTRLVRKMGICPQTIIDRINEMLGIL
jgi:hypothetical protein